MKPLWQSYGLFSLSGAAGRLGGGKKDLAMLFVYVSVDQYLKAGGRLGFVITQSVFKTTGAGDGFRQFRFKRDEKQIVLAPTVVHDLSSLQVFEGATNRTAVFVCEKTLKDFRYPVKYVQWKGPSRIDQDETLATVRRKTDRREIAAVPIEVAKPSSPWLTASTAALSGIQKAIGKSAYGAYAGSCTWLNGVYWIRVIKKLPNGEVLIENLNEVGKIKVEQVQMAIESALVYPLLRGRDINRWQATPAAHILLTQDPKTRTGIPEKEMKRSFPKTYSYLKHFERQLRNRSGYKQYFEPTDPFWTMYNVGSYTLAPWKVLWPEVGHTVRAGVCGPSTDSASSNAIPDHTLIAVSCESDSEAFFVAALLNSSPAQAAASGYIVLHPSPHILEHIAIPRFVADNKTHAKLARLAEQCHVARAANDEKTLEALEADIDKAAARLWGITEQELGAVQDTLGQMKHTPKDEADEESDDG